MTLLPELAFGAPVQDFVQLLRATLIDFTWIAHAPLGRMAAISIQDDANMAWHRPLFELIKQSALVNPIKKAQEQRCGRAFAAGPLSLSGAFLPGDDAG